MEKPIVHRVDKAARWETRNWPKMSSFNMFRYSWIDTWRTLFFDGRIFLLSMLASSLLQKKILHYAADIDIMVYSAVIHDHLHMKIIKHYHEFQRQGLSIIIPKIWHIKPDFLNKMSFETNYGIVCWNILILIFMI